MMSLALTLALTIALTLVISLGGGIMLTSTASCVQAGCECDALSFYSSFDFSYLFRWRHHAHVDYQLCSSRL